MNTKALEVLSASIPVISVLESIRRDQKHRYKTAAIARRLHTYVDPCMKHYGDPGYCWRVAWSIYCSHVNPSYRGCNKP